MRKALDVLDMFLGWPNLKFHITARSDLIPIQIPQGKNLVYFLWLVLTGYPQTVDWTLFKNSNVLVYMLNQWIRRKWQYIGWEKRKRRFVLLSHWLRVRASPRSHNHDLPLIAEFYPTQTCQKAGFLFKCPVPTVLLKGENIIRIREFRRAN